MKLNRFDISSGIYDFCVEEISTLFHSHPITEIIIAEAGTFSVDLGNVLYSKITLAVVPANLKHKLIAGSSTFRLIMLEDRIVNRELLASKFGASIAGNFYVSQHLLTSSQVTAFINYLEQLPSSLPDYDNRVVTTLQLLNDNKVAYAEMMSRITDTVFLSESRISHLFKADTGVSIKKFLTWSRLKHTIDRVVNQRESLFRAALASGFYDQAHMSKAFKELMGLNPSQVYNSRMLQE